MPLVLLIIALLVTGLLAFFLIKAGGGRFPWIQFYIRGKESGFTVPEITLLRRVAVANKLKQPASLFWSVKTLDRCIRSAIIGFRAAGATDNPRNLEFINKLFDFRARVEFAQPKYRLGLTSTRGITPGQSFKITLKGVGVYLSKLVETNRKYMAITYPRGKPLPPGFSWKKQTLRVYFWRQEDAGYYFETSVIGDFLDRKVPILHVGHVDSIIRSQKRRSVRRDAGVPAILLPLQTINQADEAEVRAGGYRCKLLDISEDGAAVAVGGKVKAGLPVKIQARPGEETVVLNGVVKAATHQQKNNVSVLHIEGQRPSPSMRIRILVFVYALFGTDSETVRKKGRPAVLPSSQNAPEDQPPPPKEEAAQPPIAGE